MWRLDWLHSGCARNDAQQRLRRHRTLELDATTTRVHYQPTNDDTRSGGSSSSSLFNGAISAASVCVCVRAYRLRLRQVNVARARVNPSQRGHSVADGLCKRARKH